MTDSGTVPLRLKAIQDDIWEMLTAGASNRKSPLHIPVLASIDQDGSPRQRIMVLRETNRQHAYLRFHTDSRSPKTTDFTINPSASVLGYDADKKVQLRMQGVVSVEPHGELADTAWEASAPYSRRCYMIEKPPGTIVDEVSTGLPEDMEGQKPSEEQTSAVRDNFSIIKFTLQSIDWLYLHNQGNISARFDRQSDNSWNSHWQIP